MARPTKPPHERSSEQVNIRLSPVQLARLQEQADKAGTTVTDFVRASALGKRVTVKKSTAPEFMTIHELRRIGVNLNQIAHAMNAGGITSPDRVNALAAKLDTLFDKWLGLDTESRPERP